MIAAPFRVLWTSTTRLFGESLLFAGANVVWFALTLPLHALLLAVCIVALDPFGLSPEQLTVLPILLILYLALALPTPAAAGLYHLARPLVNGEAVGFAGYWSGLRTHWRQGALMFVVGLGGLAIAFVNYLFYARLEGAVQWLSLVWVYAALFWLALQAYLYPLLLSFPAETLVRRYRRAALFTLGNPVWSLLLLALPLLLTAATVLAPPLYPLLAMAYLSLVGCQVMRDVQARLQGGAVETPTRPAPPRPNGD